MLLNRKNHPLPARQSQRSIHTMYEKDNKIKRRNLLG
uniref:Uncharacterized protein n=1 Tax=Rhizophora mucronata TaxID=61149 RepID=A0A2P2NFK0_RHIMU